MNINSFQTKLRIIVIIMLVIIVIVFAYNIYLISKLNIPDIIKDRFLTIEYIFIFLELILGLVLFFYIPVILLKSFKPIQDLFSEIERGKLDIHIPEEFHKGPIAKLIHSTNIMIKNLHSFDKAKRNKIREYKNRLDMLIKNINDAAFVVNKDFEIVMINDNAKKLLGIISTDQQPSLTELHFEGEILKYFDEAITKKILIPERKIYFPKIKKHVTFKNGVIHDEDGKFSGMVIVISDINLKKLNGSDEEGKTKSEKKSKN